MSKRYWVAVLGYWLSFPLTVLAAIFALNDTMQFDTRMLACFGIFLFGWGARRFLSVVEQEYRAQIGNNG